MQDQRFRKLCQDRGLLSPTLAGSRSGRQESVLLEAAARVRRYTGLSQNAKHYRPLIVALTKYDAWAKLIEGRKLEPWVQQDEMYGLDLERIERRSEAARNLMRQVCPEVVAAAENFARDVAYVPVSALGQTPLPHPQSKSLAIRPRDIAPIWATIPLLYGMCRWMPGLIPACKRKTPQAGTAVAHSPEAQSRTAGP
jgi:hypothetical protein